MDDTFGVHARQSLQEPLETSSALAMSQFMIVNDRLQRHAIGPRRYHEEGSFHLFDSVQQGSRTEDAPLSRFNARRS